MTDKNLISEPKEYWRQDMEYLDDCWCKSCKKISFVVTEETPLDGVRIYNDKPDLVCNYCGDGDIISIDQYEEEREENEQG